MNNILFQYLDNQKIKSNLIQCLRKSLASKDVLILQALDIVELSAHGVCMSASDSSVIDTVKSKGIDTHIYNFFRDELFNGNSLKLELHVKEEDELIEDDENVISDVSVEAVKTIAPKPANLKPDFTFSNFVKGNSNTYAFTAAYQVAKQPGISLNNPLFIYGEVGLGKTHLLHAVAHEIHRLYPEKVIRYVSCETLLNEYLEALRNPNRDPQKQLSNFRLVRQVDVLLVDDIQFIANKEAFQEEFYNTYNSLNDSQKQIVLAADRTPQQIKGLQDRLTSRFKGGLLADMHLPDLETRMVIIENLCRRHGVEMGRDCIEFLASSVSRNVRELQGAFTSVMTKSSIQNVPIDRYLIEDALVDFTELDRPALTVDVIQEEVSRYYDIDLDDLLSDSRRSPISHARQVGMYLVRELTNKTLKEIAESFKRKDHVTASHACRKVDEMVKNKDGKSQYILDLKRHLQRNFESGSR